MTTTLRRRATKFGRWAALLGTIVLIGGVFMSVPVIALSGGLVVFAGMLAMIFGLVGSF